MKKFKKFLILLILIAIISVIVVVLVNRKKKVVVNDYTLANSENIQNENLDTNRVIENGEVKTTINKYVKIPTEDDANKINAGITNVKADSNSGNTIITMDSVAREVFDAYGKGDIFILNGDENTPLKEVYFGKIVSKYVNSNSDLIVEVENPALDEIFDEFQVNNDGLLTEDNVRDVKLVDGVSLRWVDSLESEVENVSNVENYQFGTNNNFVGSYQKVANLNLETNGSFVLDLNLGVNYDFTTKKWTTIESAEVNSKVDNNLKIDEAQLQLESNDNKERKSKKVETEKYQNKVTVTEKDGDYEGNYTLRTYYQDEDGNYRDENNHLIDEEGKLINSDGHLVDENDNLIDKDGNKVDENGNKLPEVEEPITLSKLFKDDAKLDSSFDLSLTGKVGFENIGAKVNIDYSIFDDTKMKELSFGLNGKAVASLESKIEVSGEIGGKTTKFEIPKTVKVTGLNNKLLPLGYISFTGVTIPLGEVNTYLNNTYLDAGILIYTDAYGKIDLCLSGNIDYSYGFDATTTLFRGGQFVNENKFTTTEDIKLGFEAMASATVRLDLFGFAGIVTLGNVTMVEIDLVDIYFDLQAKAIFKMTAEKKDTRDYSDSSYTPAKWESERKSEVYGYGGLYVDLLRLQIKFKFTVLPDTRHSKTIGFETDKTFYTIEVWKFGGDNINDTSWTSDYTYNEVSATTPKYEIYRDSKGKLVRREVSTGTIATYQVENFVIICGIDNTYVYVLRKNGTAGYNMSRIKINGTPNNAKVIESDISDMIIARNVEDVLLEDDNYIYYTEKDGLGTIKRIKRSNRKITDLCTVDNRLFIKAFNKDNNIYVAAIDNSDSIGMIFGYDPEMYSINKDTLEVTLMDTKYIDYSNEYGYGIQADYIGKDFLRNKVSRVNFTAKNGTTLKVETTIGYNGSSLGEFVIHNEPEDSVDDKGNPTHYDAHRLGYYSSENGEFITVATVNEEHALWTATVGKDGRVYYVDEDSNTGNKELCSALATGGDVKVEKVFEDGEFNVNMHDTGSAIMNSTMIFYSFNGDDISIKYRYDLDK